MSQTIRLCVILSVFLTGFAFHLVNDQFVSFNYYLGSIELPFSFMLVAALCVGIGLGMLACLPVVLKLKRENYALDRQRNVTEKELNNLRIIPIKDGL